MYLLHLEKVFKQERVLVPKSLEEQEQMKEKQSLLKLQDEMMDPVEHERRQKREKKKEKAQEKIRALYEQKKQQQEELSKNWQLYYQQKQRGLRRAAGIEKHRQLLRKELGITKVKIEICEKETQLEPKRVDQSPIMHVYDIVFHENLARKIIQDANAEGKRKIRVTIEKQKEVERMRKLERFKIRVKPKPIQVLLNYEYSDVSEESLEKIEKETIPVLTDIPKPLPVSESEFSSDDDSLSSTRNLIFTRNYGAMVVQQLN